MIKGIDHISIAVLDISRAAAFFENALGLKISHTQEVPQQGVKIAFIELGNTSVELIEPLNESANLNKFLKKRGQGLHHIAFAVDDIEKLLSSLREKGVKLIDETPRTGAEGKKIAFLYPDESTGVLIEICEARE